MLRATTRTFRSRRRRASTSSAALVDNARSAGVAVDLDCDARPASVPAAVDVAAYRIVQESLTNVMRHAGANATATVTVRHAADEVAVEVVDDGRGAASAVDATAGGGHGIVGMSERAATVGGSVVAGPRPGGGFRVLARLPLRAPRRSPPTRTGRADP